MNKKSTQLFQLVFQLGKDWDIEKARKSLQELVPSEEEAEAGFSQALAKLAPGNIGIIPKGTRAWTILMEYILPKAPDEKTKAGIEELADMILTSSHERNMETKIRSFSGGSDISGNNKNWDRTRNDEASDTPPRNHSRPRLFEPVRNHIFREFRKKLRGFFTNEGSDMTLQEIRIKSHLGKNAISGVLSDSDIHPSVYAGCLSERTLALLSGLLQELGKTEDDILAFQQEFKAFRDKVGYKPYKDIPQTFSR